MAYVKISLLSLFLLATLVLMFPTKKVTATESCKVWCTTERCSDGCECLYESPWDHFGECKKTSFVTKRVEEHPNLCKSHTDCTRKGSGSFCAIYANTNLKYGACFDSSSDAQASFKNALSSEFSNLLKMPSAVST